MQSEGSFLDAALVEQLFSLPGFTLEAEPGTRYAAGLDLGHANDASALAIVHKTRGDVAILDRLATWTPTKGRPVDFGEVEQFIRAAHKRFRFRLRLDPWQGISLAQRLRDVGIRAQEFHFGPATKQQLASVLLEAVNVGGVRLYEDEHLTAGAARTEAAPVAIGGVVMGPPVRRPRRPGDRARARADGARAHATTAGP